MMGPFQPVPSHHAAGPTGCALRHRANRPTMLPSSAAKQPLQRLRSFPSMMVVLAGHLSHVSAYSRPMHASRAVSVGVWAMVLYWRRHIFRTAVNAEKQISPTRAGSQRLTEGVLSLLFHPCPSAAPPRPRCSPTAASGATRSRTPSSCNQSQIVVGRDVGFYSGWVNAGFPTILQRIYPHTKYRRIF